MKNIYKLLGATFLYILFLSSSSPALAQCGCNFVISLSAAEWQFDGAKKGVKPGDKICFASGTRTGIELMNITGTAANPVIITNMCDGKVIIDSPVNMGNCVLIKNSKYYRFTGTGITPNPVEAEYGIQIKGAQMGLNNLEFSSDFEIDHIKVSNVGCCGIVAKTDPTCDPATQRGNFIMRNTSFHDLTIDNTGCEGFYIGNSHYDEGKDLTCNGVYPTIVLEHDIIGVKVYNTRVLNTGQDGIQIGSSQNVIVHHNYVFNSGSKNVYGHTNSIQIGGGTTQAEVYNNIVDTGNGYGLFDVGGGGSWYNNLVMNVALAGVLLQDVQPNLAPAGFRLFNNIFVNCKKYAVEMYSENTNMSYYHNNIIFSQAASELVVKFNNPSKNKWTESNNIRTTDATPLKFKDIPGKDFRLQAGSSAIDAGKDLTAYFSTNPPFVNDLAEKTRPKNLLFDIGAYEFQPLGPTSKAGTDVSITLPTNSVTLNGSGDSQTGITGYKWTKKSGGAATLTNDATANLTASGLVEGSYVFELTVTDADGFDFDVVTVNVLPTTANQNPKADAGQDKTITLPTNTLVLNGIGTDTDGSISAYEWIKVSGPAATLANAVTPNLSLSALVAGSYVFQLTVTDNKLATASDQVNVTVNPSGVNQIPVVNAGTAKTIFLPTNQVSITATASDADGTIKTILWEKKSGGVATLGATNALTFSVTGLALGSYTFRITVTDDKNATAFSEIIVKVLQANQSPTVDAGANQTITLPTNNTTITAIGADPDGSISSYAWTKVSGPAATLANTNTATLTVTNMVQGAYVFGVTVTDNSSSTGYDEVTVAVSVASTGPNETPLAIAGDNLSFSLPTNSANLYGSGFDPDGAITKYAWAKTSGGTATLTNTNQPTLSVSGLQVGQYTFALTVTDDKGATDSDVATITVSDIGTNIFPTAYAGADKIIRLPQNSAILNGSGTDTDGQITSFAWTQVSGTTVTISSPNSATANVTNLALGDYVFRLTVTDNLGATDLSDITVRIVSSSSNLPPVVNAGADVNIFLPQNTLTLNASASDDGAITTYQWVKLGGPSATLTNPTELALSLKDLVEGSYSLQLTVTDNNAASVFDIVKITVLPATFSPPVVNAGLDKEIILPVNQITLTGTASSPNGTIVSTKWVKTIGPAATLTGDNTLILQASNMIEGSYVFKLTATDSQSKEVSDNVQVVVKPIPPNQPPIVNLPSTTMVELPTSQVSLQGTASDSDGTVASMKWTQSVGPSTATLQNATTANLTATGLIQGTYIFRLTVTDDKGASGFNEAIVSVANPTSTVNTPPVVFAGDDVVVTLPITEVEIIGRTNDLEGPVSDITWEQVSGTPATFTVKNGSTLYIEDLSSGLYVFRLSAIDADAVPASDDVQISVIEKSQEIPKFFSPNNDGVGDVWVFRNVEGYQQCKLKVFSRSGQILYEAAPYVNTWDGTYNGKQLGEGDYYYNLVCDDGRKISGAVRIIK